MKPIAHIGIDPGKSGAAALIADREECGKYIDVIDWADPAQVADGLREWAEDFSIRIAVLEKVHSMPKQGVSSSFNFGDNFGCWKGMLAMAQIPFELVSPQKWQKGLFGKADGVKKERSLSVVRRIYPGTQWFTRKKDHNRADAVLMARYGMGIKL